MSISFFAKFKLKLRPERTWSHWLAGGKCHHKPGSRVMLGTMPTGLAEMFFALIKGFSRSAQRFLTMTQSCFIMDFDLTNGLSHGGVVFFCFYAHFFQSVCYFHPDDNNSDNTDLNMAKFFTPL